MSRVFALMAHDPATGCATAPVAVAGVGPDGTSCVSWVPYHELADGWRARLATTTVALGEAIEAWGELADGVAWDVVELEAPASPDLRGSVEAALDEILAMAAG
ncbi:MAG: hypothetical protein ACLGI2_14440 [Acidimicrobiia bacterium]